MRAGRGDGAPGISEGSPPGRGRGARCLLSLALESWGSLECGQKPTEMKVEAKEAEREGWGVEAPGGPVVRLETFPLECT